MAAEPLIVLEGVEKVYALGEVRVPALRGIDLEVEAGEFLVLLGPSGSGKTTTLNLIGGLDRPTGGRIWVDGRELTALGDRELTAYRRERVGFVFQFFNLIPTLTARENVEFALELVERDRRRVRARAEELLSLVGLQDRMDHFPSQLSGGEQQRVAIARALANRPSLILCDEPTGNLDVEMGRQVLKAIHDLNRQEGTTVILVTHNTAIAGLADRIVRLRSGRVDRIEPNPAPIDPLAVEW